MTRAERAHMAALEEYEARARVRAAKFRKAIARAIGEWDSMAEEPCDLTDDKLIAGLEAEVTKWRESRR